MKKGLLVVLFLLFLFFIGIVAPILWGGPEGARAAGKALAYLIGVPLGLGGAVAIIYLLVLLTEGWTKFQDWYKERQ